MEKLQDMLECAEKLNKATTIEECQNVIKNIHNKKYIDYNLNVTVFVMHINKILNIRINNITEQDDEKYPEIISKLTDDMNKYGDNIILEIQKLIAHIEIADKDVYIQYLRRILKFCILKSFEYKTDFDFEPYNEWNTSYRREERARDYMKQLIEKNKYVDFYKFTQKYKIEIPFMYVFIWDIRNMGYDYGTAYDKNQYYSLYEDKNKKPDGSYNTALRWNLKYYLKYLSKDFLEIVFKGTLSDEINREIVMLNEKTGKPLITIPKKVNFENLLPTLISDNNDYMNNSECYTRKYFKNAKQINIPFIRKEIYKIIPLVPTRLRENKIPKIALKLMSDVFSQELQTDKLNHAFENLIKKLNLNRNNNENQDISADVFNEMTNNIDKFLKDNRDLILKSSIYDSKYEKKLDALVDKYKDKLNPATISDIQASRDLSRIAPEKMDLILMPIFRSIEQELRSKIFNVFFDKFKGLNYIRDNSSTGKKFQNKNIMLGNIEHYNREFLEASSKYTLAYYFNNMLLKAGCEKQYYALTDAIKKDEDNKLSFSDIRNAVAHRNEEEINKFPKDIVDTIMDELVEAPKQLIGYLTEIGEKIATILSNVIMVPSKGLNVKVKLIDSQYCFELDGFIYKCTKPDDIKSFSVISGYSNEKKCWIVK